MRAATALLAVVGLAVLGWFSARAPWAAGVVVPGLALLVFVLGFVYKVVVWGRAPVPFNITSVAGQQDTLPWIRHSALDSPRNGREVLLRLFLDVVLFRTLFRNTRVRRGAGKWPMHVSERLLWAASLLFHYSLLVVLLRHLRYFFDPPPALLPWVEHWDGFFQITTPTLFMTDVLLLGGLLFLLGRRLADRQLRYLSLPADYFPLFLLLAVGLSGVYMRHLGKVDLLAVKQLTMGLATLSPVVPDGLDAAVFLHLALVSALLVYFPFSKLMHMGGIFLSPTKTLANDNRRRRHVNPWNPAVDVHTYAEWEAEFSDKLVAAGYTLDTQPDGADVPSARA